MKKTNSIAFGLLLILAGLWVLIGSLGYEWVSMEKLWPVIVIIVGLFSLGNGLAQDPRDSGGAWFGCAAALCGGLFAYITLGPAEWGDLSWLWPAFPVIAGLSWIVAWVVDLRQVSNLVAGLIALAVGGASFLFTYGQLDAELGKRLISFWPLILIALGLGLVVQFLVHRPDADRD